VAANKDRQVRREALKLLAQVEKQGLDIAERYRSGDDMTGDYRGFRNFVEKVDHFYVFIDLVEERLPQFDRDKRDALARHLAEIRWRITIVEVDTTQIFLVRIGETGKPWPLGSRQFLERRLARLGEIAEFHDAWGETYSLPPLGAALVLAVENLLKAQIARAPGLDDFSAEAAARHARQVSATPSRPRRGIDLPRPVAQLPRTGDWRPPTLQVRELSGRFYAERDSIGAVAEACRQSRVSMDQLAQQLGMSRPALALILSGTDPMSKGTLEALRSFVGGVPSDPV